MPRLGRVIRLVQLNLGVDLMRMVMPSCSEKDRPLLLLAAVDRSGFRRQDDSFAANTMAVLLSSLIGSVTNILRGISSYGESRRSLEEQIEIIRCGALTAPEKGATA